MINKVMLVGRVGKKETKTMKNGNQLTVLSLATSKKWMNSQGQQQEETTWHNINCFNKLGEIAAKYVEKGNLIVVIGEIQNRKQESANGETKYFYSITADELKFIPTGKKKEDEQSTDLTGNTLEDDLIPF